MKSVLFLKKVWQSFMAHDPFTHSAATAYYAIFSLPGLLIMLITIASFFFEEARVEQAILGHIRDMVSPDAAENVYQIMERAESFKDNRWAMIVGIAVLLFGATGLFVQLQRSLNRIWDVDQKKSVGFWKFIQMRATSFGIILAIGLLLLISLSVTATITALSSWLSLKFSTDLVFVLHGINILLSFVTVTALFTLIYRFLPDVRVPIKYVVVGGAVASFLFLLGEHGLNYYFHHGSPASVFGAASSLILLMLWVSYSCIILLIGAEFTRHYAELREGHKAELSALGKHKKAKS